MDYDYDDDACLRIIMILGEGILIFLFLTLLYFLIFKLLIYYLY